MDILIDFDGTCVTHDFPRIGKDIGAVPVLKELIENDHRLILFTMRSDHDKDTNAASPEFPGVSGGKYLTEAINWFAQNSISLYGIQKNPTQSSWTSSPKAYGGLMIDDSALGCPLIFDAKISSRPFVDWRQARKLLQFYKII